MSEKQALAPLVEDYLDVQYDVIVVGEQALRDGRLEFVHPTRVASRRYRTVLRDLNDLFDPAAGMVLEESLRWYAGLLGQVRDLQIARDELLTALQELPKESVVGPVADVISDYLARREQKAMSVLVAALDGHRYSMMMEQLGSWHEQLPVDEGGSAPDVKQYVKRARRRFERRLDAASEQGNPDELVHDARKAAKRARYVAELAQPALGGKARSTVKRMTAVQNQLGADQDYATGRAILLDMATADLTELRGSDDAPETAIADEGAAHAARTRTEDLEHARFTLGVLYASMSPPTDPANPHTKTPR